MIDYQQQFQDAAITSSKALAEGNHILANKQAKILNKIFVKVQKGELGLELFVDSLNHPHLGVRSLAAINLLRLKTKIDVAVRTLENIADIDESFLTTEDKLRIFTAKLQLINWREKGEVT